MILAVALLSVNFAGQLTSPRSGPWPAGMANSKIAKESDFVQRLSAAMQKGPSRNPLDYPKQPQSAPAATTSQGGSRTLNITYTQTLPGADAEAMRHTNEALSDFRLGQSQPWVARKRLEAELMRTPDELVAKPLMDIEMAQGDFVSAYKVAVPFVRRRGGASRELLLRASLAAAKCGEVYPGQRELLVNYLVGSSDPGDILPFIPSGESPDVIAALSACAVGDDIGVHELSDGHVEGKSLPFYEMARSLDSTDPLFCAGAAIGLGQKCRYSEALKVLAGAYPRTRSGYMHDELLAMIRGYRATLKEVGEGHPLYPPPIQAGTGAGPTTIKPYSQALS